MKEGEKVNFFDSEYDELHRERDQLRRQKSSLDLDMDYVDYADETGTIKDYDVSLEDCTCTDFSRRHKPCKHMYCLARELGVFEPDEDEIDAVISSGSSGGNPSMYHFSYAYSMYAVPPKDFVVIDFETANSKPDSVCQIGIAVVENNSIAEGVSFLIRPPYDNFSNSKIHGITLNKVKSAPNFSQLWSEISKYFSGRTIAAYNLPFDLSCLLATLERYEIEKPTFEAFDVLANVRYCARCGDAKLSNISSFKLVNVARALGFSHDAHEALSDATVTAKIQNYCSERFPDERIAIHYLNVSSICESIAKSRTPLENVIEYARELAKSDSVISYDEYKSFLKLIEQVAARHDCAPLYKYCGMIYERLEKIDRALFLYKKSMSLDTEMKLKTRIQKLERMK